LKPFLVFYPSPIPFILIIYLTCLIKIIKNFRISQKSLFPTIACTDIILQGLFDTQFNLFFSFFAGYHFLDLKEKNVEERGIG